MQDGTGGLFEKYSLSRVPSLQDNYATLNLSTLCSDEREIVKSRQVELRKIAEKYKYELYNKLLIKEFQIVNTAYLAVMMHISAGRSISAPLPVLSSSSSLSDASPPVYLAAAYSTLFKPAATIVSQDMQPWEISDNSQIQNIGAVLDWPFQITLLIVKIVFDGEHVSMSFIAHREEIFSFQDARVNKFCIIIEYIYNHMKASLEQNEQQLPIFYIKFSKEASLQLAIDCKTAQKQVSEAESGVFQESDPPLLPRDASLEQSSTIKSRFCTIL